MENPESQTNIEQLALADAKRYVPPEKDDAFEFDCKNQHYMFYIDRGRLNFTECDEGHAYATQSMAIKKHVIKTFFEKHVLIPETTFKRPFNISIRDATTRDLFGDDIPHSLLTPTRLKTNQIDVLIPDYYAMENYFGSVDECDPLQVDAKVNKLFFVGASAGSVDPAYNERLQLCKLSLQHDHAEWLEARISELINMPYSRLSSYDANAMNYFSTNYVAPKYQKINRHLVSVDGYSTTWDRPVWILKSNSLLWMHDTKWDNWYYPLMKPFEHYIPFGLGTLKETWERVKNDVRLHKEVVQNAHTFYESYLTLQKHAAYAKKLFEYIYELKEP